MKLFDLLFLSAAVFGVASACWGQDRKEGAIVDVYVVAAKSEKIFF